MMGFHSLTFILFRFQGGGFTKLCRPHQMPLESGQSRAMKAEVSNGDTGLSNRK